MPVNGKVLRSIPLRYRGTYVNPEDGSKLYVDESGIIQEFDYQVRLHKDSLDFGDSLSNDTVFHLKAGDYTVVNRDGEFLKQRIMWTDTLFILTPDPVLRKYKGYLFLNTAIKGGYVVQRLELRRGVLSINEITTAEEIQMLNEFDERDSDTITTPYSPDRKEFNKFLRKGGFQTGTKFVRIK